MSTKSIVWIVVVIIIVAGGLWWYMSMSKASDQQRVGTQQLTAEQVVDLEGDTSDGR